MRIAALVLGILGGILAGALGAKWLSDANTLRGSIDVVRSAGADMTEIDGAIRSGYCLIGSLVLGVAGGILVGRSKGKLGGALMLVGALVPVAFGGAKVLVFTFLLLLAGVFGLIAKPKAVAPGRA